MCVCVCVFSRPNPQNMASDQSLKYLHKTNGYIFNEIKLNPKLDTSKLTSEPIHSVRLTDRAVPLVR